ncbi:MAG: M6 family metalloprotease domain-containing protein [Bacteroidales bacterium]|nr:M6 family metalloprotease domain-containing protein [Bacteroidales bacterium]
MKRIFIFVTTVTLAIQQIFAVPAYPHPINYTLPDGSQITIQLRGSEWINWAETLDGFTLLQNSEGFFEYATLNEHGDLTLSGIRVNDMQRRTRGEQDFLHTLERGLTFSDYQIEAKLQFRRTANDFVIENVVESAQRTQGSSVRIPVILVGFSDQPFTRSEQDFVNMFNQPNFSVGGATGSVRDYFYDISHGQLDLQADVFGPFILPGPISRFTNNTTEVGGTTLCDNSGNSQDMARLAIDLAISQGGANFANYAVSGIVPTVHIIFAGHGTEAGAPRCQSIWSHAWSIQPAITRNGVTLGVFSTSPELRGNSNNNPSGDLGTIGVIVHELGHSLLGWPDSYSVVTNQENRCVDLGTWCVMAGGVWNGNPGGSTPARPSAWFVVDAGWAEEVTLSTPQNATMPNPTQTGIVFRINTTTPGEYFLLENRQRVGWDAFIPASGMLIYHVDRTSAALNDWRTNRILTNCNRRRLYIKQAGCATANGCVGNRANDVWGRAGFTAFTDNSTPNARSWVGALTNRPVTNIVHNAGARTISFAFMADATANSLEIIADAFPYTQIPTFLRLPASLSARAVNSGTAAQTNVRLSATLNGNSIGQSAPVSSIATGAVSPNMTFTPSRRIISTGNNTIVYTVSGTQANHGTKNTDTFTFVGTDGVLAVDNVTDFTSGIGSRAGAITLGNIFEITDTVLITGVQVGFGSAATLNYSVSVFAMTGASTIAPTPLFTQPATRRTTGFYTVNVPETRLNPGRYFVSVNQLDTTHITVAADDADGRALHIRNGNNLVANSEFGALAIRMVLAKVAPIYGIALSQTDTFIFRHAFYGYSEQTALEVTVTNTGNRPTGELTIELSGENSNSFTLSETTVPSIAIHGTGIFSIVPNIGLDTGTYTATVTVIGDNDVSQSFEVSFTVNPVPAFGIMLDQIGTYIFTEVFLGYDDNELIPLEVTITNVGYQPTGTLALALNGENASSFTLSQTHVSNIAVDGIDNFFVVPNTNLSTGIYTATVTVTGNNGILEYFNVSFTVNETTSISFFERNVALSVFPNPVFDGILVVEVPDDIESAVIQIYNLSGQLVLTRPVNRPETEIDISHLPNGMYIVRVGHHFVRIIKQ